MLTKIPTNKSTLANSICDRSPSHGSPWLTEFRIHPNLRSTVYCNAIAAGGADEWNFAWEQFKDMTIATEAEKIRAALACTKQTWLLNR